MLHLIGVSDVFRLIVNLWNLAKGYPIEQMGVLFVM